MKRKLLVVLAILAMACWAGTAVAATYDLIGNGATTGVITLPNIASGGFAGTATADFTLDTTNNQLDIVFTNTTSAAATDSSQVLAALFWTSVQTATGSGTAALTAGSSLAGATLPTGTTLATFWGYGHDGLVGFGGTTAGNQGVSAVGLNYYLILSMVRAILTSMGLTIPFSPQQLALPSGMA